MNYKYKVGDLVKRKRPLPEEKDQLWLITRIEDIVDSAHPFKFIHVMNTYNSYSSKFVNHIFCESFEKVE